MIVYAVSVPYEGPIRLFATEAAAEAYLASDPLYLEWEYFVEEWPVHS